MGNGQTKEVETSQETHSNIVETLNTIGLEETPLNIYLNTTKEKKTCKDKSVQVDGILQNEEFLNEECSQKSGDIRKQTQIFRNLEFSEETINRELNTAFQKKKTLEAYLNAVKEICLRIDASDTVNFDDVENLFQKLIDIMNTTQKVLPVVPIPEIEKGSKILFQFKKVYQYFKSSPKRMIYLTSQRNQDSELRAQATGLEDVLFNSYAFLNSLDEEDADCVTNLFDHRVAITETIIYLGKLKAKTRELLRKIDVVSACRAATYVNLYFRLAILRTMVLWQVFYIKKRSDLDQTSTKWIFAMINENKKADLEMFEYVTEVKVPHVLFLSVFNPTENDNFLHFVQIYDKECKIQKLIPNKYFLMQTQISDDQSMVLRMPNDFKKCIYGTSDRSSESESVFTFVSVKGRELDNVFYLKTKKSYLYLNESNKYCYQVDASPGSECQWKLVSLENDKEQPKFIISSLKWPGWFLYLHKGKFMGWWWLAVTDSLEMALKQGRWTLAECQRGEKRKERNTYHYKINYNQKDIETNCFGIVFFFLLFFSVFLFSLFDFTEFL